jgi:heat shock protein 4
VLLRYVSNNLCSSILFYLHRLLTLPQQDWLYDEGDDTTKSVYIAKIEEIRALAGPVVQRHFEKVEAERRAVQERLEAERARKAAEAEAARKAAEAEKAAQQQQEGGGNGEASNGPANNANSEAKDEEMTDADATPAKEEEGGAKDQ